MYAIINNNINTVQDLLKVPAIKTGPYFGFFGTKPINYADQDGNTALIHAVKNIHYSYIVGDREQYKTCVDSQNIVQELLNTSGIDPHHVNKNGETAISLLEKLKASHAWR